MPDTPGATTICPNLSELALATGVASRNLPELACGWASAGERTGHIEYLTVTMSEKGIRILYPNSVFHSPTRAREVFDVTGAGDTVIATLAASLSGGLDPEAAVTLANIAAGIVVAKSGTAPISRNELIAQFTASTRMRGPDKILELAPLLVRLAEWRANGDRIVFTNGCFDILHVGHITLLEQCRAFGDKIVIGINSDASVKGLKGPTRPVVGEQERARVLAALAASDAVIIFDQPTPLELIRAVRPDVLVKGGDYTADSIVGAEDITTWGGPGGDCSHGRRGEHHEHDSQNDEWLKLSNSLLRPGFRLPGGTQVSEARPGPPGFVAGREPDLF